MKVRTKLIIGFSVIVVLLLVMVFVTMNNLRNLNRQFRTVQDEIVPDIVGISEIDTVSDDAHTLTLEYIFQNQPKATATSKIDELMELVVQYLAQSEQTGTTGYTTGQTLLVKMELFTSKLGILIDSKESGTGKGELEAIFQNECLPAFLDLQEFLYDIKFANATNLAAIGANYKQSYNSGVHSLLTAAILITFIGLAAAFFTTRSIIKPLQALRKGTEMIAQGNLDYQVGTRSQDEIGQLSRAFDKMTLSLKKSMTSIDTLNNEISERRKTEEALKSREQRFLDIAENALEWIWETDAEGKFTYSSPIVEKILGYKPEEILGKHFYDFYHPEERKGAEEGFHSGSISRGPFHGFINRNIHKNGKLAYLSTSGVPIIGTDGSFLGCRGLVSDITEHKTKDKLQQDENSVLTLLGQGAELREILGAIIRMGEESDPSIKGLIMLYDPVKQRIFPECSPNLPAEFLEVRKEGARIRPDRGVSSSAAYRKERVIVPDITISPLFRPLEKWIRIAVKNNLLACWSQPILASNGDLLGTVTNYSNRVGEPDADSIKVLEWSARIAGIVIERKQAEKALRESEEKFFKAFHSSPYPMVISTKKDGRFVEVNDSFADISGHTREEVIGRTHKDLNIWAQAQDRDKMIQILNKEGRVLNHKYHFRIKSGEIHTWLFSAELIDISSEPCIISTNLDITEYIHMENELRFFTAAFKSLHEGIIITDIDSNITYWNKMSEELFGIEASEAIGKTVKDVIKPIPRYPGHDKELEEKYRNQGYNQDELIYNTPRGKAWVKVTIQSIERKDGKSGAVITLLDITKSKKAEEALRASEARLQGILKATPLGIVLDRNRIALWVNEYFTKLTGYPPGEIIGKDGRVLCNTEEEYEDINRTLYEGVEQHGIGEMETQLTCKNGAIIDVVLKSTALDPDDPGAGRLTTFLDITQHKRMLEALRESEEKFNKAFHASPAAISISHVEDGSFIDINDSYMYMTGYNRKELIGHRPEELNMVIKAEQREEIVHRLDNLERTVNEECNIRIKSGKTRTLLVSSDYITINGNLCVITINTDITERKQMEEKLKKALADLEQSSAQLEATNKELESFSYSVSHDLRSPLRSIDGFSQALLEDYAEVLDETGQDYLQRLRNASQKMGELIDGILKLSRLTRSEMHQEDIDLSALVGEITDRLQENQPKRRVDFKIRKGLVTQGDPQLLRALLENLLGNAWKFTKKRQRARIEFGTVKNGGKATYFIKDNGAGFDMTYADKLFTAFQRLHEVTEFPGTGIGLATVQRIINRHGGKIWAEGAVNKGATFYFTLN